MMTIPSWLIIGVITFTIAFFLNQLSPDDRRWFFRLRRPRWLTFEGLIPFIWILIFICGIFSATVVWDTNVGTQKSWLLMAYYLILEVLILAYTPVMCKLRSLTIGTIIGAVGFLWGLYLAIIIVKISLLGFVLLFPYLLWSPIGTYVTWVMIKLNPSNA